MRPAGKVPNVYSHIVLEFYDKTEEKSFILGTAIETNGANNCQSYRYVMDRKSLEEVEHVCVENGIPRPYTASELQKRYRLTLLNREQGLPRFMQMTGLKLTIDQLPTYLRKLRGIMSYDPNAKIDRFIRESVLEEKNVDFSKLIEARENIERLNGMFSNIQNEIGELEGILAEYDGCESEKNRLLTDNIKISYKKIKGLNGEIERQTREQVLARQKKEETDQALAVLNDRMGSLDDRLMDARVSLNQLDSAKMIEEEKRRLEVLEGKKKELALQCRELEDFQTKISEILHNLLKEGGEPVGNKEVLASLCSSGFSAAEKRHGVEELKKLVDAAHEKQIGVLVRLEQGLGELGRKLNAQLAIIEECKKYRNAYGQIPEYVGLRDEIQKIYLKGDVTIQIAGKVLEVGALEDGIEFFADGLEKLESVEVRTADFVTVEKRTAYFRCGRSGASFFYLGGYATRFQRDFLKKIYQDNPQVRYLHFGDIDAGDSIFMSICAG